MTLTLGSGPFGPRPGGVFNFEIDAPGHRIYLEDFPRRVRAIFNGATVVDTRRGKLLHETGHLPVLYFPRDDLAVTCLEATNHRTHCPFKGDACYWSLRVGDHVAENAVWGYPEPLEDAPPLAGYVAAYWEAMDTWLEESEPVFGRLRDPYHRVDVREGSERVKVFAEGEVVAESHRPKLMFETGLPTRYYLPREDVRTDLLVDSSTVTVCPYKGTASYWSVRAGDGLLEDRAFSYREPLPEAAKAVDHVSFLGEGIEVDVEVEER